MLASLIKNTAQNTISYVRRGGIRKQLGDIADYYLGDEPDIWTSPIAERTLMQTYQSVLWVYHGVFSIAMTLANIPLRIRIRTDTNIQEDCPDHPANTLLNNPNRLLTKLQLIAKTVLSMELTGNGYWIIQRDLDDSPIKLHTPRPDLMTVERPGDGDRRSFTQQVTTVGDKHYPDDDVVHFRHINPFSASNGLATVLPGKDSILLEVYLAQYAKDFFQNAVVPSVVFTTEQNVGAVSYERFKHQVRTLHQGAGNLHKSLFLDSGIHPEEIRRPSPVDSGYVEASELQRDKILFVLGCYHLIALAHNVSGEGLDRAEKMYYYNTILPRGENVAQTITKELLNQYPDYPDCFAEFDTRGVPALQADAANQSMADFRGIMAGWLGKKETRVKNNYPRELAGDDETGITNPNGRDLRRPADSRGVSNEERDMVETLVKATIQEILGECE